MDTSKFINREVSWLEFNSRVLDEAADKGNPLLERMKFLAIFSGNLDEFFMVRVSGVRQQVESKSFPGYNPGVLLEQLQKRIRTLLKRQYKYFNKEVAPELDKAGVKIEKYTDLPKKSKDYLKRYYKNEIEPVLTPIGIDQSHPFPLIRNCGLEILVRLVRKEEKETNYAIIEVPSIIPRFVSVPAENPRRIFVTAEDIICHNLESLISGCGIIEASVFRITRDMDFSLDEESIADLLSEMQIELQKRTKRRVIRLEVPTSMSISSRKWLMEKLNIDKERLYSLPGLLDLKALFGLVSQCARPDLLNKELTPLPSVNIRGEEKIFDAIKRKGAFILHHPYESFEPVVKFIQEAAEDPSVLAVKQTLYRVSGNSPIIRALAQAARNGKQVTVLIELKARFDEENNIEWAKELAEAGAHVVYGIAHLKVHCKALLVIRRESRGIKRYVHLGTGNYNDSTAKLYTDIGMFSDDDILAADISALFNVITGFSKPPSWKKIMVAPFTLRERLRFLIEREARVSTKENQGHIMIKVNSLIDEEMMETLYRAAAKNVRIELVVRGICGMNPFIDKKIRKNIKIVSVIDRFLEHPRIYYFRNNGNEEVYVGSADMMPRNLDRRIELLFPVDSEEIKVDLKAIVKCALNDRRKGRHLIKPNYYSRTNKALKYEKTRSQIKLYEYYLSKYKNFQNETRPSNETIKIYRHPPSHIGK